VTLRRDRVEVERLQHRAPEALEAPGRIVHPELEEERGVEGGAAGDHAPYDAPVSDPPTADVARPENDVGALLGGGDQTRDVPWVVREVAVHLQYQLGSLREGPPEAREV